MDIFRGFIETMVRDVTNEQICLQCCEKTIIKIKELMDYLEENQIDINSISDKVYVAKGSINCTECSKNIDPKDIYFLSYYECERFIEDIVSFISNDLSEQIEFCSFCGQGNHIESYVNHWNRDLENGEREEEHRGMDFTDFLENNLIPESLHEDVVEKLICQNCGYGGSYDKDCPEIFNLDNRIYSRQDIDSFYGVDIEEFNLLFDAYDMKFHDTEIYEFIDYVLNTPMISYKHSMGIKIFNLIKHIYDNKDASYGYVILKHNERLYRGRKRKKDSAIYDDDKLWNPPSKYTSHGRYNMVGVETLYCCNSKKGIAYEVNPQNDECIDIATLELKSDLCVLHIGNLFNSFRGFLSERVENSGSFKHEYILPNYIRDCCKVVGFNGVIYKGLYSELAGEYDNVALFSFKKEKDIRILGIETTEYVLNYQQLRDIGIDLF